MIGVYEITCVRLRGRRYIGSSSDVVGRIQININSLRRGDHHNKLLQSAWRKYGDSSFDIRTIATPRSIKKAHAIEEKEIAKGNCFNINICATSHLGVRNTPAQRRRQ